MKKRNYFNSIYFVRIPLFSDVCTVYFIFLILRFPENGKQAQMILCGGSRFSVLLTLIL